MARYHIEVKVVIQWTQWISRQVWRVNTSLSDGHHVWPSLQPEGAKVNPIAAGKKIQSEIIMEIKI